MRQLVEFIIGSYEASRQRPSLLDALEEIGVRGKVLDLQDQAAGAHFTDEVKSKLFITAALDASLKCPICSGYLLPSKSISFDHVTRISEGGNGAVENGQLTHPYCNTGMKG